MSAECEFGPSIAPKEVIPFNSEILVSLGRTICSVTLALVLLPRLVFVFRFGLLFGGLELLILIGV